MSHDPPRPLYRDGALVALGRGGERHVEDAVGMLLDCHQRIRSFAALAVRLSTSASEPETSRVDAARRLHRYFTIALPLHVADEEQGLKPRLLAVGGGEVAAALATMTREHEDIERRLDALAPLWEALVREPDRLEPIARTSESALELERLFVNHLALEESTLFPAARRLPQDALAALALEMRARREPGSP